MTKTYATINLSDNYSDRRSPAALDDISLSLNKEEVVQAKSVFIVHTMFVSYLKFLIFQKLLSVVIFFLFKSLQFYEGAAILDNNFAVNLEFARNGLNFP